MSKDLPPEVKRLGFLEDSSLSESSGVAASRKYPGVFWTHNDGNRSYTLFAITREGRSLGSFQLAGVVVNDWEDIAIDGENHLYVGDVGNNDSRRFVVAVHQIDEPDPKAVDRTVKVKRSWQLRYPKVPFDCETLLVWQGHGYLVTKVFDDARAEIYRFALKEQKQPLTLEFVTQLRIDSPVTGGDISADGTLLALVAKSGAFVYRVNGDISKAGTMKPVHTKFRYDHPSGRGGIEGCCFVPEGLLATSESRDIFLFTDPAFHPGKVLPDAPR